MQEFKIDIRNFVTIIVTTHGPFDN